jgi:hypothetical protein
MKKLLLLLTVIALCGCEKHEETPNYLVGNTFVRVSGGSSISEIYFTNSTDMINRFNNYPFYDSVKYNLLEISDTSQIFHFENFIMPPHNYGIFYFKGKMRDTIVLRAGFKDIYSADYDIYGIYAKQ